MFSNTQFLRVAKVESSLPTLTAGEFQPLRVDESGRLYTVPQDLNVLIDFLGLNGAPDSSNILVAGTEDGTGSGTAHAMRVTSNGSVVVDDGGGSLTVDGVDFDIRDLLHTQDSVKIGDGVDFLDIVDEGDDISTDDNGVIVYGKDENDLAQTLNFEGENLKVTRGGFRGTDASAGSDVSGDGAVEAIDNTFTDLVTDIAVGAGQVLEIYGVYGDADKQSFFRLVRKTSGVEDEFYLLGGCYEERSYEPRIPDSAPLRIIGAANVTVNLQAAKMQGAAADMAASGQIFARLI